MEGSKRRFVVSCTGCRRRLMVVGRIRDAEIAALKAHLRVCLQMDAAEGVLRLAAVMDRIHVAVAAEEIGATVVDGTR